MLYLSLRQYQYILAVADAKSLTRAALALHVSQPSLSVAITRAEARLGRLIFNRGKGSAIDLTPFGYRIVAQIRALLRDARAIEESANLARPFVLGCFEDIAPWYLPKVLAATRARFPDTDFQGVEGRFSALSGDLVEGRIDLAISYDIGFDDRFARQQIKQVAPVAFVAADNPLAALPAVGLHQLTDQPLILSAEELSQGYIRTLFDRLNISPTVAHTTASLEMMRSLAAHGAGVGISYSNPPAGYSYDGQPLVTVPIDTPQAAADIVLLWVKRAEDCAITSGIFDVMRRL
ncbi:LysR family transcriptional regulator [Sulfitobacter sp. F26169L]|uniref:LysR family transcriptional regulator n=1 Tax=Sulfitobacter sp. F26169L TaxID=2996015 RepID=UPI00226098BF|nr:LysR family transcriptional regulator [Sulfitobacter sp. F26169L]MCX7568133.1 LysR family transcriptional regulator [Sulfitobacter sp. F26169L]